MAGIEHCSLFAQIGFITSINHLFMNIPYCSKLLNCLTYNAIMTFVVDLIYLLIISFLDTLLILNHSAFLMFPNIFE